jgi:Mn2+/Fe2+ NRAMP family transporter
MPVLGAMKGLLGKIPGSRAIGPGLVSGVSGNDAGSIATGSIIGAALGYQLLWMVFFAIPILISIQEMTARAAVIVKKGLGAVIRERYGAKVALGIIAALLFTNIVNIAANIGGMVTALELATGINDRIFVVPVTLLLMFLVLKGSYRRVEKALLFASLGLLSYIIIGFISVDSWGEVIRLTLTPTFAFDPRFVVMAVALLGATVTPYIYYYNAGAEIERSRAFGNRTLNEARIDASFGAVSAQFVAYFIIVVAATVLFSQGITTIETAKDAALALKPLAGDFAFLLFAIGLFSASMIAASVLPLATAYAVSETFGWESGIENPLARNFRKVFVITLGIGALIMLAGADPIGMMFIAMLVAGIVSPVVIALLLKVCNDRRYMGEHANSHLSNVLGYIAVGVMGGFVLLMAGTVLLGL